MSADDTPTVSRRDFILIAGGTTAASAAAGQAAAQDGNATNATETGAAGGGVTNGTSTETAEGNGTNGTDTGGNQTGGNETSGGGAGGGGGTEEVTVGPGGDLTFEPADLEIVPGTTVKWVWDSDGHNVVPTSQPDGSNWQGSGSESELFDTGHEYEHAFDTEGDYEYECTPHAQAGMTGSISVTPDAGGGGGGGGGPPPVPDSARTLGVASAIGLVSTLGLAYFLMRYGGDYRED